MSAAEVPTCLFCGYKCKKYRTDVMRKHMKVHHSCPEAVKGLNPAGVAYNLDDIVEINPYNSNIIQIVRPIKDAPSKLTKKLKAAYCYDCWNDVKILPTMKVNVSGWEERLAEQHVCKAPVIRPKRGPKKKVAAAQELPTLVVADLSGEVEHPVHSEDEEDEDKEVAAGPAFDDQQLCKAVLDHFSDNKAIKKRIQYYENEYDDGDETDHELILQAVMDGGDPEEEMKLRDELWQIKQERDHLAKQLLEEREEQRLALKKQAEFFMKKMAEKEEEIDLKRAAINLMSEELAMFNGCTPEEVLENIAKAIDPSTE